MPPKNKDDINQLKKKLLAQKREISILSNIIENLPGSIYWKDKNGIYLGRNSNGAQSVKNMGYPWRRKDHVGKTDYDLFSKEMADGFKKNDLYVMRTGKEYRSEEASTSTNGEKLTQLSIKWPLRDEKNKIIGIVGNTIDITYLKKIEADLIKAKEEAEAAIRAKDEFIRNVEHDIRTPFSGITILANMLESVETDALKKEYLTDISKCAKELHDYCNSILEFAKTEAGIMPILEKKLNLRMLIEKIISMEIPPARNKNLALQHDIDKRIPAVVIGDPNRIQRILINLVSNAIKFTQKGYVKIRLVLKKKMAKQNKVVIQLIIEDSGIGIPKEKHDIIYEKFSRLTSATQGVYKGSGLGLRVVRQLIDEIEGEIDVKSELHKGTTFICTIPFKLPLIKELVDMDNHHESTKESTTC